MSSGINDINQLADKIMGVLRQLERDIVEQQQQPKDIDKADEPKLDDVKPT